MTTTVLPPSLFHPDVEVRVSTRRRKTVGAHWEGGQMVVVVPSHLSRRQIDEMVPLMVGRLERLRPNLSAGDEALTRRAGELADRYVDGVRPSSIGWSARQHRRWGSCTLLTRTIRISDRLRQVPEWVLDAVVVHELAHLLEPNHSPRFRAIAARYPRLVEADAYLDGYALGLKMDITCDGTDGHGAGTEG